MTRMRIVGAGLAGLMVLSVLVPAVASAGGQEVRLRHYRGKTSQGETMSVTTYVTGTTTRLHSVDFEMTLDCEGGTELGWSGGWIFDPGWTLSPARLDYDEVGMETAMHVHGRLGTHVGSGTASDTIAALTADEQARLCTTGELTWRAWRTDAGARAIVP